MNIPEGLRGGLIILRFVLRDSNTKDVQHGAIIGRLLGGQCSTIEIFIGVGEAKLELGVVDIGEGGERGQRARHGAELHVEDRAHATDLSVATAEDDCVCRVAIFARAGGCRRRGGGREVGGGEGRQGTRRG